MTRRLAAVLVLSLSLFSQASRAQGPSEPGTPDASWARLVGRVVDELTRQPSASIPVLLQCSWVDGRWGRLRATTDANGQFTIATPAGQCTLAINVPYGLSADTTGLPLYEFAPGEIVETVSRLYSYPAAQPIEGRVLDDRGEPVSGTSVILRSNSIRAGAIPPTETDATGTFRFPAVGRSVSWEIVVPALGLSRLVEVARGASASTSPVSVVVRGALLPAFRVSGRVETSPGKPRTFARIFLDRADPVPANSLTIAETSSDPDGNFAFPRVPAGSYRVRIDTTPPRGPGNPQTEISWAVRPVVVTNDVSDVVLDVMPGPELRAEVRLDDQTTGLPERNILLRIDAAKGRSGFLIQAPGGRIVTRALFPDRYRIGFSGVPTGYRVKSVIAGGRDVTVEGFDLRDGPIGDMVITLTKQLSQVTGVVRDSQDRPHGEAAVIAFPTNRQLWIDTGDAPAFIDNVHVSQRGNYSIKGLPPGEILRRRHERRPVPDDGRRHARTAGTARRAHPAGSRSGDHAEFANAELTRPTYRVRYLLFHSPYQLVVVRGVERQRSQNPAGI